jgi:hypothetical protein
MPFDLAHVFVRVRRASATWAVVAAAGATSLAGAPRAVAAPASAGEEAARAASQDAEQDAGHVDTRAEPEDLRTQPVELGTVRWLRDLGAAQAAARERGLPILLCFQQVPGGDEHREFGATALSHPLAVDTIEEHFVPLCILNNAEGVDAEVLARFGEAPWNHTALRVIDADGATLVARVEILRTTNMLCEWLLHTCDALERPVPHHLDLVRDETLAYDHPQWIALATFGLADARAGERHIGALAGVLRTRVGRIDGRPVVEVEFDPRRLPYADLVASVAAAGGLERIHAHDQAQARLARRTHRELVKDLTQAAEPVEASEQFHALRRTPLAHLPLSPVQCTKLNAALRHDAAGVASFEPPLERFLSRRQLAELERLRAVLARDPTAFAGWLPPTRTDALWEYRVRFEQRLSELEADSASDSAAPNGSRGGS